MEITNRGDCCHQRLSNFQIHIGNSLVGNGNANRQCGGSYSLGKGETREKRCPYLGRYVNIVIPNREEYVTLCVVNVYLIIKWYQALASKFSSACVFDFKYLFDLISTTIYIEYIISF